MSTYSCIFCDCEYSTITELNIHKNICFPETMLKKKNESTVVLIPIILEKQPTYITDQEHEIVSQNMRLTEQANKLEEQNRQLLEKLLMNSDDYDSWF